MNQGNTHRDGGIDNPSLSQNIELADELEQIAMEIMTQMQSMAGPKINEQDLSFGQYRVLSAIHRHGPTPIGDLGRRLGSAQSTISEMIARLSRTGLVEKRRHLEDGRVVIIQLTGAGTDLMNRRRLHVRESFNRMLKSFTDSERERFINAFRTILSLIDKRQHPAR